MAERNELEALLGLLSRRGVVATLSFCIVLEHLSAGAVCSLGKTPPGPTPRRIYWKPRAPNRGFRFIAPHT
jgi:hypothetical protein